MLTLTAEKRKSGKGLDVLRKGGKIPAVFYGAGKESTPISVSLIDFKKVWKEAGESTLVALDFDGEKINTLIHEMVLDPVAHTPSHIDFIVIDMKKKTRVHVPIEFSGEAPAVKNGLGTLAKTLHEIEVEALPSDLPHTIVVDISTLTELDSQIHVSDIKAPTDVLFITEGDEVVASISAIKEEKEEVAPVDLATAVEVEKKGKKEEEGEAAPAEKTEEAK